jgi:hypothetical protein
MRWVRALDLRAMANVAGAVRRPPAGLRRRATMRFDPTSEILDDPRVMVRAPWRGLL